MQKGFLKCLLFTAIRNLCNRRFPAKKEKKRKEKSFTTAKSRKGKGDPPFPLFPHLKGFVERKRPSPVWAISLKARRHCVLVQSLSGGSSFRSAHWNKGILCYSSFLPFPDFFLLFPPINYTFSTHKRKKGFWFSVTGDCCGCGLAKYICQKACIKMTFA